MKVLRKKILFILGIVILSGIPVHAQITQEEASAVLREKNIPEDTLLARLIAKGIDPAQINPEDLPDFQAAVEQTIAEIEEDFKAREVLVESAIIESEPVVTEESEKPTTPSTDSVDGTTKSPEKTGSDIYGHAVFDDNSLFLKLSNTDVKPPDSYILGEGDRIGISIFGPSVENQSHEINKEGYITPSRQGRILLKGLTWGAARESLKNNYAKYYSFDNNQFEATIAYARNINVNVLGSTRNKGSIVVPATNTVFNVLAAAGGISKNGSVRKIKIISNAEEKEIDVYTYLSNPVGQTSHYLNENDIVFVPIADKIVSIKGAVVRPMKYELLENENLKDILKFAGGLRPDAYQKDIQIRRFIEDEQIITNVNLREILSSDADYELYSGDEILITSIESPILNYVNIIGAVVKPGNYERLNNMRLSDLLNQSVLRETARMDFGYILRYNTDDTYSYERININQSILSPGSSADPILRDRDKVVIQYQSYYGDSYEFRVSGAVRSPGTFEFDPSNNVNVDDALLLSGGVLPQAADFGFVIRKRKDEPKTVDYIPINVQSILSNPNSPDNITLIENDLVRIIDKANYRDEFFIKVSGAVREPGIYEYDPNLELTDFLKLAGGLKFSAATNKIDIARVVFNKNEPTQIAEYTVEVDRDLSMISDQNNFSPLQPFDHIYVREIPDFELQQTIMLNGEVKFPGEYTLSSPNEKIASLIQRAGGLTSEAFAEGAALIRSDEQYGFVVIHLDKALKQPNSIWNLILKGGDKITIPKQNDLVLIEGAINAVELYKEEYLNSENQIAVNFEGEKSALYYIKEYAAGVADNGSKKRITVEQPNGKLEKSKSFLFFKFYPKVQKGAKITVGRKPVEIAKAKEEKEPVDWNRVLSNAIAQATTVLTLILLVNNIN